MLKIKQVKSQDEFEIAMQIRMEVFVGEQGVPEDIEKDEYDKEAIHVVAYDNRRPVGCGRIVFKDGKAKLGRIAVLKDMRGSGVGKKICEALVDIATEFRVNTIYLHAQMSAQDFYLKQGFIAVGEPFYEADILHIEMEKKLSEQIIIIGIAGGTGSGKTTLVRKLKNALGDEVLTLTHDFYYKANDHLSIDERKNLNYDHPNSFDTDTLIQHLIELKKGNSIERPVYDFTMHTRAKETVIETPKKVIIVEGILIFESQKLRKMFDIKVFVDTDADVRIIRRILRDVKERERDLDSVIHQYLSTVKMMHEEFVEPSKRYADIIIPEGGYNRVAYSMLLDKIRLLLGEVNI